MKQLKMAMVTVFAMTLMACVTVNVYFPAAAAESAADRLVKEVYGLEEDGEPGDASSENAAPAGDDQSALPDEFFRTLASKALDFLVPVAHAQQPDINISTPGINKLKGAMRARHARLKGYYGSGAIGMAATGLLTVRNAKAVPIRERNKVKQLVSDENRDRNALYSEVAAANGHPEWEKRIRATFAKRWVANAPGGWWYQTSKGAWKQK